MAVWYVAYDYSWVTLTWFFFGRPLSNFLLLIFSILEIPRLNLCAPLTHLATGQPLLLSALILCHHASRRPGTTTCRRGSHSKIRTSSRSHSQTIARRVEQHNVSVSFKILFRFVLNLKKNNITSSPILINKLVIIINFIFQMAPL